MPPPLQRYVIVGTAYLSPVDLEPKKGRILVFSVSEGAPGAARAGCSRRVVLVSEKETKGAIYALADLSGKLVASCDAKVQIYQWVGRDGGMGAGRGALGGESGGGSSSSSSGSSGGAQAQAEQYELRAECGHHLHILVLCLRTDSNNHILVGDLMRSMTLLAYREKEGTLEEVARHFDTNYMRTMEIVRAEPSEGAEAEGAAGDGDWAGAGLYLGADDGGNIFMVSRMSDGAQEVRNGFRGRDKEVGSSSMLAVTYSTPLTPPCLGQSFDK